MVESIFHCGYSECRKILLERLAEPAPGRIQILTGPRQVGKTTLLLDISRNYGKHALYVAGDDPNLALAGYWDRLWADAEERAEAERAVVMIDEVHHIPDWARCIKAAWDRIRRLRLSIHILVSGSSSLRIGTGAHESLAGRFERITLTHWSAAALSEAFGASPAEAAVQCVKFGGYPGAVQYHSDFRRWQAYIRDAIIEPAIGRDILALGAIRRPALLRQVFAVALGSPAQVVSLQKIQGKLQDRGALETLAHYLDLLREAYLIAGLEKYSARAWRRRSAPPKLVVLNNALISATHPNGPPDPKNEPARFGTWVENACLAHAVNQGQRVTYWREEPLEIDAVIEGSWGKLAVEIKTSSYGASDLKGVLEFSRRNPGFRPLIITSQGDERTAQRLGLASVSWMEFLQSTPHIRELKK